MKITKRIMIFIVTISLLCSTATSSLASEANNKVIYETITNELIVPGLTYEKKTKITTDGWVDIHVLKMDLNNENITLDILRSDKGWGVKDTLTGIANEDATVVAGINGSFFDMNRNPSDSLGTEFDGVYSSLRHGLNMDNLGYASLIQTADGVLIDFLGASIGLISDSGRTLSVAGINRISNLSKDVVIFNSVAMKDTTTLEGMAKLYKIVVDGSIIQGVVGPGTVATIPDNGYIITIPESISTYHVPYFPVGTVLDLNIKSNLGLENLEMAISGSGLILKDGSLVAATSVVVEPTKRHPRSAVGITADGKTLIAMVVDGRGSSIGATHNEMAKYLLEYNVATAMHFDGGGSSEIVANTTTTTGNTVMNTLSEGSQRKIVNGVGFVSTAPIGPLTRTLIVPSVERTLQGMPITLKLYGLDAYNHDLPLDLNQVTWSVSGIKGSFIGNVFTPTSGGTGTIIANYQGMSASIEIQSINNLLSVDLDQPVLKLSPSASGTLQVTATDLEGYSYKVPKEMCNWIPVTNGFVTVNQGIIQAGLATGVTELKMNLMGVEVSAYASVGSEKSMISSFETAVVSPLSYPESLTTYAALAKSPVSEGSSSIELRYSFNVSSETQAAYAVLSDISIPKGTESVGIYAYGNKSGLLLKGLLTDATGKVFYQTFSNGIDFEGWKYLESALPTGLVYPVTLSRIYVASLNTSVPLSGTVYLDQLMAVKGIDFANGKVSKQFVNDSARGIPSQYNTKISIFGATASKNTMLDSVVMNQVYKIMKDSDIDIYAGASEVNTSMIDPGSLVWKNAFSVTDYDAVRVITLATGQGGLIKTDSNQLGALLDSLNGTSQENIIIVANKSPIEAGSFTDKREGEFISQILSEYQQETDKKIYYVNASGYETDFDYVKGVRYIELNGLWFEKSGNQVDLLNTFYMLNFYLNGNDLYYSIDSIY